MLPCYVLLDLETMGGNATIDRITEIAAVRVENGIEVARWSTLVNPGVRIPPFIQSLTGISDAMVATAPAFDEVARQLLDLLDGAVLVAHNVRFDHGFIVNELQRLERRLQIKTLCTVRLSRALYPQFKSHGLDAILARHGLHTLARHRAMGDVEVVLAWLEIARTELGREALQQAAQQLLQGSASLPPQLETALHEIPDTPGVYLMYGEGPLPLYIGKSITMRKRVLSHFQASARVAKEMRLVQEVRRVEWRETAGELGALLLESRLVKDMQPVLNRRLRSEKQLCAWRLADDPAAQPLLNLVRMDDVDGGGLAQLYGVYRSKRQALESLRDLAELHKLCPQAIGLESGKGPCFACQIGHCTGVCAGRESPAVHHLRLQLALAAQRLQAWPYPGRVALREHDTRTGRTDVHIFEQWCHLATVRDEADLEAALQSRRDNAALAFDLDTYRLLLKRLAGAPPGTVFALPGAAQTPVD